MILARSGCCAAACALLLCTTVAHSAYFDSQRKGANFFNARPTRQRFQAARAKGIRLIRLTPSKWRGQHGRFLLGDSADYQGLNRRDLAQLRAVLRQAERSGLKVILVFLTVPGSVWRQQNTMAWDTRLWRDRKYHAQLVRFWRDIALALRDQPALVGYNLLNEPFPERVWRTARKSGRRPEAASDLNQLYRRVVAAIRQIDKRRAIILDGAQMAAPDGFSSLRPITDPNVLYAFHVYEPWELTTWRKNRGRFAYPGPLGAKANKRWDAQFLARTLTPIRRWQTRYRIPSNRIIVGEFGIDRRIGGAQRYLADLIAQFNRHGWHWLFYSFREDDWPGMDYELGRRRLNATQWARIGKGLPVKLPRVPNRIFDVLQRELLTDWRALIPAGRKACLLLYDLTSKRTLIDSGRECRRATLPCSTFKIVNALIGLETGVLRGPSDRFHWGGRRYGIKPWNRDHTLQSAMRYSVVWAFQQLATRIGLPSMRTWLRKLRYGDQNLSGGLTLFWLTSLKITAPQQLELLRRLYRDQLPFRRTTQRTVRELLVLKRGPGWRLSGKTGTGLRTGPAVLGWFVGHLDRGGHEYLFVLRLRGARETWGPLARETMLRILRQRRLLPP